MAQWRQSTVSFTRLRELLQAIEPDTPALKPVEHRPIYYLHDAPPAEPLTLRPDERLRRLRIHDLCYEYPDNGAGALHNINLVLANGSFTVITGRIGAGKSTLLKVILGLLPQSAGEIYWNDELGARSGQLLRAAAQRLHPTAATPLQRQPARKSAARAR